MNEAQTPSPYSSASTESYENSSAIFLLAEYERLRDLRTEVGQRASRRFEFYLTITSAALGAYLIITQTQATISAPQYLIDLIALGFLGYGVVTFLNLTSSSTFHLEIVRAFKEIQRYFISRDAEIERYLYFSVPTPPPDSYKFLGVLARGTAGGSEKTVIAFINSTLVTYLMNSLLQDFLAVQLSSMGFIAISVITFLATGLIHAIYVTLMYRYVRKQL